MSIVLLTPLMLAVATPAAQFDAPVYSHQVQVSGPEEGIQQWTTGYCSSTSTFNGTQTFAYDGRPRDADNDSDQTGDC
jgi:hypothetical protein